MQFLPWCLAHSRVPVGRHRWRCHESSFHLEPLGMSMNLSRKLEFLYLSVEWPLEFLFFFSLMISVWYFLVKICEVEAVSYCQHNMKILFQDLSALFIKALGVQEPLIQVSVNHHTHRCTFISLDYNRNHMCLVCSSINTMSVLSARLTCYTFIENFHRAKFCMRGKLCSIIIIIFIFQWRNWRWESFSWN